MITERQAILEYITEFGEMVPARMHAKVYHGHFFGSEVTRACRYLVAEGLLTRRREGKYTKFFLSGQAPRIEDGYEKAYVTVNGVRKEVMVKRR